MVSQMKVCPDLWWRVSQYFVVINSAFRGRSRPKCSTTLHRTFCSCRSLTRPSNKSSQTNLTANPGNAVTTTGAVTPPRQMQTTYHYPLTAVVPAADILRPLPDNRGKLFAPKSSSRQNCAKDMRILTARFRPILPSRRVPKLRPFSST